MLERMWRKGNPLALLVGMKTDITTMENNMEIPLKKKKKLEIKPSYDSPIPLHCIYPEKSKIEKDTGNPIFTAAVFTIARTWK